MNKESKANMIFIFMIDVCKRSAEYSHFYCHLSLAILNPFFSGFVMISESIHSD